MAALDHDLGRSGARSASGGKGATEAQLEREREVSGSDFIKYTMCEDIRLDKSRSASRR